MLTITFFYNETLIDVDNIPKPVIDALKGLVFQDDAQLTDLICRKRYLSSRWRVANHSGVLSEGMNRGNEFLYVVVEEAPGQEVIA
jgi:hypothetical protein